MSISSLFSLRILWFLRFPIFGELGVVWNGGGLDLESVQSQQKESGRSNWAAGGRKSQCSANAWWWWWRCLWLRYYSVFFPLSKSLRNRFSLNGFPLNQMSYSDLLFQQVISHNKSKLSPSMSISTLEASMVDSQSMVNGCQWYINTFFIHWNGSVQPISYPDNLHLATAKQVHGGFLNHFGGKHPLGIWNSKRNKYIHINIFIWNFMWYFPLWK